MNYKRYLTLLLLVLAFVNIQANSEEVKGNEIVKIVPSADDDILRHLPIYRFCDSKVGLFIDSFLSSIAEFPIPNPIILITNTNNAPDYYASTFNKSRFNNKS